MKGFKRLVRHQALKLGGLYYQKWGRVRRIQTTDQRLMERITADGRAALKAIQGNLGVTPAFLKDGTLTLLPEGIPVTKIVHVDVKPVQHKPSERSN